MKRKLKNTIARAKRRGLATGYHSTPTQLKQGIKVEMEHAHLFPKNLRKYMAEKIARDSVK